MNAPGWPHVEAPFHAGEQAVQQRAGTAAQMQAIGPHVIRAAMPQQHQQFLGQLPFVVLGAADADGQPWATLLDGPPGFVHALDARQLRIAARWPAGDPLQPLLREGSALGLLGIELPTRRRNRANGQLSHLDDQGFTLAVQQSFGNCPKYIQRREAVPPKPAAASRTHQGQRLDADDIALVRQADTFFVATQAAVGRASGGSDVSHRGGPPGFVQMSDDGRTLTWPDFSGNGFFNTLGNLALNPLAGLVFVDFASGGLLHLAGRAEVVWQAGPAERLLRFTVQAVHWRPGVLAQGWQPV